MTAPGTLLTLDIERPAVGGRMIARHDGAIVLVSGAIPGERVTARVERVQRRTVFARVVDVVTASPDRITPAPGLACGGHVLAHIADARQQALKGEMVADAFRRQARLDIGAVPVAAGPADGYRTRARAHVRQGRWGFFEEGSHTPCDIAGSRQLRAASAASLDALCAEVAAAAPGSAAEVEWAESIDGALAVAHVHLTAGGLTRALTLPAGLAGVSTSDARGTRIVQLVGAPYVADVVAGEGGRAAPVRHHVRAFFQGNRYLLQALVDDVRRRVDATAIADLYAGVGLFSVALAGEGRTVEAVEGDEWAAADLAVNAAAASGVTAHHQPVESFVRRMSSRRIGAVVVDPPRTGLSPEVTAALAGAAVPRLVYVSCDPATLARDVRVFTDAGYALQDVRAFDLFPRSAHVETVVTLTR